MTRIQTVVFGGLLAGLFDILDAFIFWGIRTGAKPMRIGQSIAGGLMGEAAKNGGWGAFAVGMALHFGIAVTMALVFYVIAKAVPLIAKHAIVLSLVYGIGLFLVMTYIVVPLSAAYVGKNTPFPPQFSVVLVNTLFCHIILVGLTIGVMTKRALGKA